MVQASRLALVTETVKRADTTLLSRNLVAVKSTTMTPTRPLPSLTRARARAAVETSCSP
jgi:hypothetical protein